MKVAALVLALVASVASVDRWPTRARAAIFSRGSEKYAGTFVFDEIDSSGMLRVNAEKLTLRRGEYVVVAHTIPHAERECRCPSRWNKWQIWPEDYTSERKSFEIFTMRVRNGQSHTVENLNTSATLSRHDQNSILNGVIAVYEASTFTNDENIPTHSSIIACGEVVMDAKATLFFSYEPRAVAATLEFTASTVSPGRTDVYTKYYGFPLGDYVLYLYSSKVRVCDSDSLARTPKIAEHTQGLFHARIDKFVRINGTIQPFNVDVKDLDWYLKINDDERSIDDHPIALYIARDPDDEDDDATPSIAYGFARYL